MMFKIYHKEAPSYMCNLDLVSYNHMTRNRNMSFIIPQVKSHGQKSFIYNGIKLWNGLPHHIRQVNTKDSFKLKCKRHLMSQMKSNSDSDYTA